MLAFLFLLLLLLLPPEEAMASLNSDGYALLSLKQSISSDPEGSLSNWNSSDPNPCAWNGVTCRDLTVVSLSIPNKKLFGFIPSELGSISGLRHLNLRNNRLFGNLPSELLAAKGLQSLVLYGNSFSGSIPTQLGDLKYLQTLDISSNFFNGSFPESLIGCKRLRTLDLSRNNLTGALPVGFGAGFVSLENLDLSFNAFNASLPKDIGNLSGLRGTVDFSHNLFSGEIPASLGNLPEKVYIDLTYNNLTGSIPQTGALMNRGPTAFIGNPNLCGPPLKIPCAAAESPSSSSLPYFPVNNPPPPRGKNRGLSKGSVIAIVVSDAIGICLLGLLFSFCYSKACSRGEKDDDDEKKRKKKRKLVGIRRKECFCLFSGKDGSSESLSVAEEESHGLVALDSSSVGFDLDELLKASAFVLGKSGIGIVYKVVLEDGLTLAVRRLGEGGSQRLREFQTEVEAVGKLRHPNVAALKAYYWSVDEKLLIYDYVPNGNLSAAIHGKPGIVTLTPLSWPSRLKIMRGMARGLVYLHEFSPKKYVHSDLKPTNVLLDHNMEPRISDFGLGRLANIAGAAAGASERMAGERHQTETIAASCATPGSLSYMAPEAIKMVKPSQKWDVYSYGVILLEMITGRSPTVQVGPLEINLVRWIQLCVEEKKPLSEVLDPCLDADKDEEIVGVIKIAMACVQTSPEKRPSMRQISEALERI